jgi:hypothetical protein
VEHNPAGSDSDSASPQSHSADEIVSKLEYIHDGLADLSRFCTLNAKTEQHTFVTLYAIERVFGGHEEGGWYYDWLTPVACEFAYAEEVPSVLDLIHEKFEERYSARFAGRKDAHGRTIPSHTSCSQYRASHVVRFEAVPFASASHTRPHYE